MEPEKHLANFLRTATVATETLSFDSAEKYYEDAYKVAEEKLKPESSLALKVSASIQMSEFQRWGGGQGEDYFLGGRG